MINTPIGKLYIQTENSNILKLSFSQVFSIITNQELTNDISIQLNEYFEGKRKEFDLPIKPEGTAFQKKVWRQIANIPYGKTRTYKQIAAAIGNEKAVRAVGSACKNNPIPLIIPCHRVVGAKRKLTGYNGGIERKIFLLNLEYSNINKRGDQNGKNSNSL